VKGRARRCCAVALFPNDNHEAIDLLIRKRAQFAGVTVSRRHADVTGWRQSR